ncbi:MAG: AbrB/MazE/SpoVT family DNA-binding domain-containing protein, partial [Candidatus Omnitrophica bacterium]|nr:AbrB/MazE/SpoVT family DNA-binding domain-containing protein [Candidatus Omnitrophota bacterium]
MTVIETAKVTSKGQITIPNRIRKILHISRGSSIAFSVGRGGVML